MCAIQRVRSVSSSKNDTAVSSRSTTYVSRSLAITPKNLCLISVWPTLDSVITTFARPEQFSKSASTSFFSSKACSNRKEILSTAWLATSKEKNLRPSSSPTSMKRFSASQSLPFTAKLERAGPVSSFAVTCCSLSYLMMSRMRSITMIKLAPGITERSQLSRKKDKSTTSSTF